MGRATGGRRGPGARAALVSTHALLIWGGRLQGVPRGSVVAPVSTHALLIWGGRPSQRELAAELGVFQPTPSSYGEGDALAEIRALHREQVSTHALLIWGGRPTRPRRRTPCAGCF